jgi:hypothetical protein
MYVFLLCVLLGLGCGVFFDFQRCVRKKFFAGILRTTLEDILFATLCIGAVIALGFFFNNGEIRYYQILGSVSGALFYAALLSKLVSKIFLFFFGITEKIIVKFLQGENPVSMLKVNDQGVVEKALPKGIIRWKSCPPIQKLATMHLSRKSIHLKTL